MGCGSSSPQHQSRKVVPHDGDDNGGTTTTAKSKVAWDTDGQKDGLKVAPSAAADTSPAASTSAAATTTTPQQKNEEERGGSSSANSWLRDVLSRAGLESFADALGNDVGVKDKEDLKDVVQADLVDIGMSSEEQEAFLKLVAAVEKKADVEPAAAANEEEEDKPSAEKEEEEEKEEAPPPPPPSPAAVEEVAPGGGGCMSCVTVADGTNPDGTRKDPQTC